jgi:hypothetical protein
MTDQHRRSRATFRPPPEVKDAAQKVLAEEDWTLNDVLVACLALLAAKPKTFLKQLRPYRPPNTRGRPPKRP